MKKLVLVFAVLFGVVLFGGLYFVIGPGEDNPSFKGYFFYKNLKAEFELLCEAEKLYNSYPIGIREDIEITRTGKRKTIVIFINDESVWSTETERLEWYRVPAVAKRAARSIFGLVKEKNRKNWIMV